MHIYYEEGPPSITMGSAGTFEKGVSRDIDDKLAGQILEKKTIVFKKGEKTKPQESKAATPALPAQVKED